MRVLTIGCHPDDLEILCYGTLAKHAKNGDNVIICTTANGSMGNMLIGPKELAKIRYQEATEAAPVSSVQENRSVWASTIWPSTPTTIAKCAA